MTIRKLLSFPGLAPAAAMVLTLAGSLHAPVASARPTDLTTTPPGITSTVDPNIVVSFDDSGSMLATAMPDNVANSGHFDTKHYYSSTTNVVYYDPTISYSPPLKPDGSEFPDSTYTNAWRDGMCANWPGTYCYGNANRVDLSESFSEDFLNITSTSNTANEWSNSQECIPDSISNSSCDPNNDGGGNGGGFYYNCPTVHSDSGCVKVEMNTASAAEKQNFANWYSYYRTRNLMARTAMSRAFGVLGDNYRVAWQTINDIPLTAGDEIRRLEGDITDTNSWRYKFFTFLYDVHTAGSTPNRRATLRAGNFFMRGTSDSYRDPFWNGQSGDDSERLTCRQNYQLLVTDGYWNYSNPVVPAVNGDFFDLQDSPTLGDGTTVFNHTENNKIHWNVPATPAGNCGGGEVDCYPSLSDIAFYYWGTDLQPLLANEVPPYLPDLTTGVTMPGNTLDTMGGEEPIEDPEIYWNPKNDPANWQHMVNFMVTLGIAGDRNWPDDYDALRDGSLAWPQPRRNAAEAADDTWHAAVVSRGQYFSASNPDKLVQKLGEVLGSIGARTGSSTSGSLNSAVLRTGAYSYVGKYVPATWTGDLVAQPVQPDGTLGAFDWSASEELADVDPSTRVVFTSKLSSGNLIGTTFQWANLDTAEQTLLQLNPETGVADTNGAARLNWIRGDRSNEGLLLRSRASMLGAIVGSQPVFVSYPADGYRSLFPDSPLGSVAPENAAPYELFENSLEDRMPVVYVGANDGMLHAFEASLVESDGGTPNDPTDDTVTPTANAGEELWSFVPRTVYPRLAGTTALNNFDYRPVVDGPITVRDVFFGGAWHSILVGSLGLGGRGIYALDITDPDPAATDADNLFLWEFNARSDGADPADATTADNPANLGYTYGKPNIARLNYNGGTWVVMIPGGYFPDCDTSGHPVPCDDTTPAATRTFSSLFVLNAETGELIRELRTSDAPGGAVTSYGLATAVLGDYNSDQVADVAFAGDLVGNMWRFDLTDENEANWTVSQVFKPDVEEEQPITSQPRLFPDPASPGFIVVFGTGKYLGLEDRTNDQVDADGDPVYQYLYGVREVGPDPSAVAEIYDLDDLEEQDLDQATVTINGESMLGRSVTNNVVGYDTGGWFIRLDVTRGERMVTTPLALFSSNRVVFTTLIPGGTDPCNPERDGAVMVLDALTGGSGKGLFPSNDPFTGTNVNLVGARVNNPPVKGSVSVVVEGGGGTLYLPGIVLDNSDADDDVFKIPVPLWRRRSWNMLDTL